MPTKTGRYTPSEAAFIKEYARTGQATAAAQRAGYRAPQPSASHNLANPAIQAAIAAEQTKILFSEALPAAVHCLISLVKDARAPAGARVQASKVILDRTLGSQDGAGAKDPAEMTAEELQRRIDELNRLASDRAKPILDLEPEPAAAGFFA